MAAPGPRFCPRCGTERIGDMRFCPSCGLDLGQVAAEDGRSSPPLPRQPPKRPPFRPRRLVVRPRDVVRSGARSSDRVSWSWSSWSSRPGSPVLVRSLRAAVPARRRGTGSRTPTPTSPFLPEVTSQPSFIASPGLTAPPVGLRILSPADGAVVGARDVTVIGTAPRGAPHHAGRQLRVRPARDRRRDRPLGHRARALGRGQRAQVPDRRRPLDDADDARHLRAPGALTIRDRAARTTRSRRQARARSRAPTRR